MRKNQSSLTAAGIAIARAVESEKPVDERICYDPYARHQSRGRYQTAREKPSCHKSVGADSPWR